MDIKKLTAEVEKVSAAYLSQYKIKPRDDWYILKLQEELGELIQSYLMMSGQGRTKGKNSIQLKAEFDKEVADVLSHVLLLARHFDVDVEKSIHEKWLSWTRSTRLPNKLLSDKHR